MFLTVEQALSVYPLSQAFRLEGSFQIAVPMRDNRFSGFDTAIGSNGEAGMLKRGILMSCTSATFAETEDGFSVPQAS
ncbi:hypothetical protein [Cohnella silvisoli]|uniref:Uncharacterized protein n=1 Tax=Cohnella silvisoli TaxID=2873699 RepID=A0ABV1KV85_9BACL|nr:hypothetical protein [Cohnella silvisoli]MCD9023314.1 hypothetical protein [Cohnella silvisoli]